MKRMALVGIGAGALGESAPAIRRPAVAQQHVNRTNLQHQTEGKQAMNVIHDDPVNGFAHAYTIIEGFRVHYVSDGEGPPVLLIPGWPQTWYAWRHIMPALATAGFRAIAVDPRGVGYSGRPEQGYDTGRVAADLHALMRRLGHERYAVVGHDVGMWIGYALASDYPKAIERLAVMEAIIPGLGQAPEIFVSPAVNNLLWHFMFNQLPDLPEMLTQGRERAYLAYIFDTRSYKRDAVAFETYAEAYSAPGALRAGFSYYRAIPETIEQNKRRAKDRLSIPVLALGAEYAARDRPLATMRAVGSDVRGGVLPGCGHYVPEESPEALLEQLIPFLHREH
jgi:pimeloyl-ACP methyl ester carboxylesterase